MANICKVDGCNNQAETQGLRPSRDKATSHIRGNLCRKHLAWFLKYGTTEAQKFSQASLKERLLRNTNKSGEGCCWEWTLSSKSKSGYGSIWDNELKKNRLVHRVSYELFNGEIPEGKVVMHTCDNPKCVNPKHLILGTHKENGADKAIKGRAPANKFFGEQNPKSKLTLEQARFIKANPKMKLTELASMFGLSPNCIRGVRIGRTWKEA